MRRAGLFLALLLSFAAAQDNTLTTQDANGQTIVEVTTTDLNGLPSTTIISTILPTGVTTTLTTTDNLGETVVEIVTGDGLGDSFTQVIQTLTTTTPVTTPVVGPVGQPGATPDTAGALTPYTYTTTNANGDTTAVVATFTPSFATTIMPSATFKATVLDYSVYTASYATAQAADTSNSNGALQQRAGWWGLGLSAMIGVVGGTILLLGA
ncbi:hypothetical protein FB451DRAFT_656900 [Mycena latifolia]|nr:hypothetical protein FB451DRAFT_656900 [Mycena latifolia]